nr:restriction endonuclease subunit S [Actinomyces sp. 565]
MCPDGVEYKPLGEVGRFIRGSGLQKSDFVEDGFPCIHYGQIHTQYGISTGAAISSVVLEQASRLRHARPGDLLIATTSEDDEAVGKATAWLGDGEVAVGGDSYIFRHALEPKYVSYFFASRSFQIQKQRYITGAKVRRLSDVGMSRILIPVPPLGVQREIVRILDQFTQLGAELEVELEAELEARRDQYAYFRDALIWGSCTESRLVSLGDLGSLVRGRRFTRDDLQHEGLPAIHYGELYTTYGVRASESVSRVRPEISASLRFAVTGDVIIAAVGETVADVGIGVAWLGNEPVAYHDDSYALKHDQDPRFISYVLRTSGYHTQKEKYVSRAKVKRLSAKGVGQIRIPVPPLEEQRRIADILDKFDALVNDLNSGLPAEIAARRKQYEYYRDRLLTFPEKGAAA